MYNMCLPWHQKVIWKAENIFLFYVRPFTLANMNTDNYSAILYYKAGTIRPKY